MKKKNISMKSKLIAEARKLYEENGLDAVNIRSLAAHLGVATGTLYNYFSGKDEILMALTEEYWQSALDEMRESVPSDNFINGLEYIIEFIRSRINSYGKLLMYSLKGNNSSAKSRMSSMQNEYMKVILELLEKDNSINKAIWTNSFSKEAFARFTIKNILTLLNSSDSEIRFFIETTRRILY